jgi:hypothetical protein
LAEVLVVSSPILNVGGRAIVFVILSIYPDHPGQPNKSDSVCVSQFVGLREFYGTKAHDCSEYSVHLSFTLWAVPGDAAWTIIRDQLSKPMAPEYTDDLGGSRVDDRLYAVTELALADHAPDVAHVQVAV